MSNVNINARKSQHILWVLYETNNPLIIISPVLDNNYCILYYNYYILALLYIAILQFYFLEVPAVLTDVFYVPSKFQSRFFMIAA